MTLLLKKISLTCFRSYETLRIDTGSARAVVLAGPNGAGKTNVLEALSLLAPGRGLRGADLGDMRNRAQPDALWAVAAELQSAEGHDIRIGTGLDYKTEGAARRIVRINGKDAKSQSSLSQHVAAVWLTPQMDRIFLEGATARRKFLDRLVFAHAPAHLAHLNRYEKNMRQRLKLLTAEKPADPLWLDALEQQMAADAVSVAAARQNLLAHLAHHVGALAARQQLFPAPALRLDGKIDADLQHKPAIDVEDEWRAVWKRARAIDAASARTTQGAHRSDFCVAYAAKDMPADQCSTDEQKSLLISIILAHALMMQAERGFVPLLLLDEVAAHLDDARRAQLFAQLRDLDAQVWLTGTDAAIFAPLAGHARVFMHGGDHGNWLRAAV